MGYFSKRSIWITGASSGIGKAVAVALSETGARLILSGRDSAALEETKALCTKADAVDLYSFELNDATKMEEHVNLVWEKFGPIHILINNAGLGQLSLALETTDAVERQLFEVNFWSNIALTKALIPKMQEAGSGHILAIGSIAANFGQAQLAAYSASKAALKLYYESLSRELDPRIKIQVVSPGFIKTAVSRNALKGDGSKVNQDSPAQLQGMPTEAFAKSLLRFMQSKGFHRYIGRKELLAVPLHGLFPKLFYRLLSKS